jgi:lipoprotein-anchoring transpeptidase ErfK/SrfK
MPRALVLTLALGASACHRGSEPSKTHSSDADAGIALIGATQGAASATAEAEHVDKPMLGVTAFVTTVYKEPRDTARKLGYLRVGQTVARSAEPVGKAGCAGGWYEIAPRGFVCVGKDATIDLSDPVLRAATRPANLKTALPYAYAFVRAVLPLYLRIPTAAEQYKSEFKLKEHLEWFRENSDQVTKVTLGANDVAIDERGVPIPDKKLGELGLAKNSLEKGIGALLGAESDDDAIPFWLADGKRSIPNISDFVVPEYAAFADRARRHTGLALVGSFATGPEALNRRFAITSDLRLAPETKIKPDTGSPWHGIELDDKSTLPLGFVRSQGAKAYKILHGKVVSFGDVDYRSIHFLTGKMRTIEGVRYYRTREKLWLHQLDVGLAIQPATWPVAAEHGEKWIEVSIGSQTLVLWEGKKPVYATLVSTGQAGIDDPKKTTATVRGTFRIRNKHITATMDSNESSSVGGRADTTAARATKARGRSSKASSKGETKSSKGETKKPTKAAAKPEASASANAKAAPKDAEYGVTKRRGEGTFMLRDVPYIQYFESGYALHTAYWHDVFGTPRSHGCINLAPVDGHRVFLWTDPPVPEGWHGVNANDGMGEGTTVVIHE